MNAAQLWRERKAIQQSIPEPEPALPVGFIYVQYAGQAPPTELFSGTWEEITEQFANLFFRAQGNLTAEFGEQQESAAPNIVGQMYPWISRDSSHSTSGAFYYKLSSSTWGVGTSSSGTARLYFDASRCSAVYKNNVTEIRPMNSTIKIWKRIA